MHNSEIGSVASAYVQRGFVHNPIDVPKTTIKDTTVQFEHYGIATDVSQGNYTHNPDDVPYVTQREVGTEKSYNSGYLQNVHHDQGLGYVTNPNVARETIKQTTLLENYAGGAFNDDGAGGYISNPNFAKETQRQIGVENKTFQGGASAYSKKQLVACPENIAYLGCRDDLYDKENTRQPTQVGLPMIPISNTHGSVHLKTVIFDDRTIYPNSGPTQYIRNDSQVNEFTRYTQRDDHFDLTHNN